MSLEGELATYRLLFRNMAPMLRNVFESAKEQTGQSEYNFELLVGYAINCEVEDHTKEEIPDHKCKFEDYLNHKVMMKNYIDNEKFPLVTDPNAKKENTSDGMSLGQAFPLIKGLIEDCAAHWYSKEDPITPWDVLLHIKLVRPSEGKKETMQLRAKVKYKKSDPNRDRKEVII